jgi:copper chaperone CopZ
VILPKREVEIPNITCLHCAHTIRTELLDLSGIREVDVNVPTKTVSVAWEAPADWPAIASSLREIGYPPEE